MTFGVHKTIVCIGCNHTLILKVKWYICVHLCVRQIFRKGHANKKNVDIKSSAYNAFLQ
jgi:hypothetical protein